EVSAMYRIERATEYADAHRVLRRARLCGAGFVQPLRFRVVLPQVGAGLAQLFLVIDAPVGLHQLDQGPGRHTGLAVLRGDSPEVDDRGVVRLEPEIEQ